MRLWNMNCLHLSLFLLVLFGCTSTPTKSVKPAFNAPACGERVYNRGKPPTQFLLDLYDFIYEHRNNPVLVGENSQPKDVFRYLSTELKLEKGMSMNKRAARLYELMRVSGGMESSWDWDQGRDRSASNYDYYTREAGIFQTSPNSHVYYDGAYKRWHYLDDLMGMKPRQGSPVNKQWNMFMKDYKNKTVIMQHHAFMLRHNYRHYGPMIRKNYVAKHLNHECINQVEEHL